MGSFGRILPATLVGRLNLIFALSIAALAVRVLLVPESVVVADEYYYAKTVKLWYLHQESFRHITSLPGRAEADFPNSLFFAIYRLAFVFRDNFYVAAKLMNVGFAALMALAVRRVARHFVGEAAALAIASLALWLPSSSYYTYFMAEPLYDVLVWWGLAIFLGLVERRRITAFAALGASLGAALLAKPNAAALVIAANAAVLALSWRFPNAAGRWRSALAGIVAVNLAFVLTGYALNTLCTGHWIWDPVGNFYRTGLSKIGEVSGSRSFAYATFKYLGAYVYSVVLVFSAPLLVMWSGRRTLASDVKVFAFSAITVLGLAALLAGSVKVAVNWERVYVNHNGVFSTRYIAVLFPLLVIAFVRALPEAVPQRTTRRGVGLGLAVTALALGIVFRGIGNIWGMREAYWPELLHPSAYYVGVAVMVATILYYALAPLPKGKFYAAVLALWSLGSAAALTFADFKEATSGSAHTFAEIAYVCNGLIPVELQDKGFIVSTDRRGAILFMFRYSGFVPLRLIDPADSVVRDAEIPATPWTIYLGTGHPEHASGCVAMPSAMLCGLSSGLTTQATR